MNAIRKILSVTGTHLQIEIPEELKGKEVEIIILPVETELTPNPDKMNYDFSDLAGKLEWRGDAVAVQRSLRDEW